MPGVQPGDCPALYPPKIGQDEQEDNEWPECCDGEAHYSVSGLRRSLVFIRTLYRGEIVLDQMPVFPGDSFLVEHIFLCGAQFGRDVTVVELGPFLFAGFLDVFRFDVLAVLSSKLLALKLHVQILSRRPFNRGVAAASTRRKLACLSRRTVTSDVAYRVLTFSAFAGIAIACV